MLEKKNFLSQIKSAQTKILSKIKKPCFFYPIKNDLFLGDVTGMAENDTKKRQIGNSWNKLMSKVKTMAFIFLRKQSMQISSISKNISIWWLFLWQKEKTDA